MSFNLTPLLNANLSVPALAPFTGYPKFCFIGGNNDADILPLTKLGDIAKSIMEREGRGLAKYGMGHGSQGYRPLREVISKNLRTRAGLFCSVEEILVTSGSLQAIDYVNSLLVGVGDIVIVEEACYGGVFPRLKKLGVNVIGIDLDQDGMRKNHLDIVLADLKQKNIRPKYIFTIPIVQNPSGSVMTLERRLEILELVKVYSVPIFEDDCYADFLWEGERLPAIRSLDPTGHVIYCGSFSKSIALAFRADYLVAD